ncbi:hypothetical protein [Nocardia asteroides]
MTRPNAPGTPSGQPGSLLRRIQVLAAEQRQIEALGSSMFLDSGGVEEPKAVWQQRLDNLEAERGTAEREALLAGVDQGWIEDARELGFRSASAPERTAVRQHPDRATGAQEFFLEMLEVDLWHLERMAAMDAARTARLVTGRWSLTDDPVTQRQFYDNMRLRHQRLAVLAAAAQVTEIEGQRLWGAAVEGIRRVHTVAIAALDEATLAREWNGYAAADPGLRVPPYVPRDPSTGAPSSAQLALPPSPPEMVTAAWSALRAQFVETALDRAASTTEAAAIAASVDAALGPCGELGWEPELGPQPDATPNRDRGHSMDP